MNRRFFISGLASSIALAVSHKVLAEPIVVTAEAAAEAREKQSCLMKFDEITAEATYFSRYEHFHQLSIPISILIHPPVEGFKIRTTMLDQESLDEKAFAVFIKESGIDESLRFHSHEVKFTQKDLERISNGEKDVKITVLSPAGNKAHDFFFTAPRSAIVKIARGRLART